MEAIDGGRSSTLVMHKHSRTISKSKPKIRIIHIFAPEIIKTDVANFRELVQRLTGKPDDSDNHRHLQDHQKGRPRENPRDHRRRHRVHDMNKNLSFTAKKTGFELAFRANAGVEDEGWNGDGESSGGFLNGLGDLDGIIQELGEFPFLPLAMDHAAASSASSSSSSSQTLGNLHDWN
uniref:VQ motif-containing protein 17 n=1 Tax=Tarenaya hassleriana TaxID=28532 RepID=UPI00053C3F70|nr:PREDICTED: VQ motif-containing protein 17 [Tarenaya hassleriana]